MPPRTAHNAKSNAMHRQTNLVPFILIYLPLLILSESKRRIGPIRVETVRLRLAVLPDSTVKRYF